MALAHVLMGVLARGERHGYRLRDDLAADLGPRWRIDFGQLYRALRSMQRHGWVRVRRQPGVGGPDRKVYRLTDAGQAELRRWRRGDDAPAAPARDEALAKLQFGTRRPRRAATRDAARRVVATDQLIAIGSDDPLLDLLRQFIAAAHSPTALTLRPAGSLAGLIALRDGQAHLAGIHLLDVDSGQYNVPFIKHLLPEDAIVLLHLAQREQGLLVSPEARRRIGSVKDLARPQVRLINRQRGAGTRLFLFQQLRRHGIDPRTIDGWQAEAPTHTAVAAAIRAGSADVGPGIRAVADQWGLDFVPLGQERYEIALHRALFDSACMRPLLEVLHHAAFRRAAARFSGYDLSRMSDVVAEVE